LIEVGGRFRTHDSYVRGIGSFHDVGLGQRGAGAG
jgi:hypothetical protein